MMPGREVVTRRTETSSHTTHTWEGSEPRKEQPTDARMSVISWALSLSLPGPVSPVKNAGVRTCLSPEASFQA